MSIIEGLRWRYQLYLKPYLMLHEDISGAAHRLYRNNKLKHEIKPLCYIYADASNIGDKMSANGVSFLAGKPGVELFASTAGLKTTFKTIKWMEDHRPNTRIIIGGGGLLQECFIPFWSEFLKTELPFVLFGVGVNAMHGKREILPRTIMKQLAFKAHAIHVRDNWSQELLQFGQDNPVTVGVCPSVNYLVSKYRTAQIDSPGSLLHVQHSVDVRLAGGDPELHRKCIKELAHELDLVYEETDHIKENVLSLIKRYQRARIVVSSRLHGCIFSFALGIPFVPIVSDKKTDAFISTHIPDNPRISVSLNKYELFDKILQAKNALEYSSARFHKALDYNVDTMQSILKNFGASKVNGY